MGVLYDVLNIAKEKRYLVLAHVAQDVSEPKSAMQLMAKKKVCIICVPRMTSGLNNTDL